MGYYPIKTAETFSIPGYVSYTSSGDDARHRGGCAVLIRNRLNEELAHFVSVLFLSVVTLLGEVGTGNITRVIRKSLGS